MVILMRKWVQNCQCPRYANAAHSHLRVSRLIAKPEDDFSMTVRYDRGETAKNQYFGLEVAR